MKIAITYQTQTKHFAITKNAPAHETFEALRAFATSAFENLPEDLVFSWACESGSFFVADPQGWKVVLKKAAKDFMKLTIVESDSDDESYEFVSTTQGVLSGSESEEEESAKEPVEPVAQPAPQVDEQKQEPVPETEEGKTDQEEEKPKKSKCQEFKERAKAFVEEIGLDMLKTFGVVFHSLVQDGSELRTAFYSALGTCEEIANHQFVKDNLAKLDPLFDKAQPFVQFIKNIDINAIFAMIPNVMNACNRSREGQCDVELDLRPMFALMNPMMIRNLEAMIPNGQERVFDINPANIFGVLRDAETQVMNENPERVRHNNVECDGCGMSPIVGTRYKCAVQPNYDLCSKCRESHDPSYPMIEMKRPLSNETPLLKGAMELVGQSHARSWGGWRGRGGRRGGCGRWRARQHEKNTMRAKWRRRANRCRQEMREEMSACPFQNAQPVPQAQPEAQEKPVQEMKKEKQVKKAELQEKKAKIHALKAEAKKCRREIKSLNKNIQHKKKVVKQVKKKARDTPALDSKVVAHLNMDMKSTQEPGTTVCKTWKVLNTGTQDWKEGEVTAEFFKGDYVLVVDGFQIMQVEGTSSEGAAYINAMIQVPTVPGRYLVVYQLKHNGVRFGEKLRTIIFVKKAAEQEEERGVIEDYQEEDMEIPYVDEKQQVEEEKEQIEEKTEPQEEVVFEPVPVEPVPEPVQVPVPAPEEPFAFSDQLASLVAMGFEDDTAKSCLVATNGNLQQALELLFQA